MKKMNQDVFMRDFASKAGSSVALAAALMSVVWASFVPHGYPWPSLAWIVLACAAAVWVNLSSIRPTPRMSDVIHALETKSPPASTGEAS